MSDREAAVLTAKLFARKGDASASGFVQPQSIIAGQPAQNVRKPTLAARPVVLYATLVAATVLVFASWYSSGEKEDIRAPPEQAVAAVAALSSASQLQAQAGAKLGPVVRKTLRSPPPARLQSASVPKPSAKPSAPRRRAKPTAGARRGWRVQLVSLGSAAAVRREWTRLKKTHRDVLRRLRLTVKTNRSGSLYRLQAGPLSNRKAAKKLCATIKRRRLDCIVVRR